MFGFLLKRLTQGALVMLTVISILFPLATFSTELPEIIKLAEQGDAKAQYDLGTRYDLGDGVTQDSKLSLFWYRKSAKQHYAEAQNYIGASLADSDGVEQNYKEAIKWFTLAASQGLAMAHYNLGLMHEFGEGTPKDIKKAFIWYRSGAELGSSDAKHQIYVSEYKSYRKHDEVAIELYKEDFKKYKSAAYGGSSSAQIEVAKIIEKGGAFHQGEFQAYVWFRVAMHYGDKDLAVKHSKRLAKLFGPVEIEVAVIERDKIIFQIEEARAKREANLN
ncbi:tetratricopeptide repeat protein [Colwellia piezophila]|uniref:tetratricopeptide repeat protein n=1 Tax=Colwellia piezophila TaxID=211668 RepID=UPI00036F16A6|nr:tetratricopeptide repeat protein [Colwellia piezophila]